MVLHLRAKPNARVDQLRVAADGTVSVHLKAPPHDGQANAVLLAYLAEVFGTSKSRVELLSGHTAPLKRWTCGLSTRNYWPPCSTATGQQTRLKSN